VDVRRLAAVDMHGLKGTRFRAWLIVTEFVLGAVAAPVVAVVLIVTAPTLGWSLFAVWTLLVCLNYVPLAVYAVGYLRSGAYYDELAGADVRAELKHYGLAQMWVFVPLSLIVFALRQRTAANEA
jgi:hypothetical protein